MGRADATLPDRRRVVRPPDAPTALGISLSPELMAEASRRLGWLGVTYAVASIVTHFGHRALLLLSGSTDVGLRAADALGLGHRGAGPCGVRSVATPPAVARAPPRTGIRVSSRGGDRHRGDPSVDRGGSDARCHVGTRSGGMRLDRRVPAGCAVRSPQSPARVLDRCVARSGGGRARGHVRRRRHRPPRGHRHLLRDDDLHVRRRCICGEPHGLRAAPAAETCPRDWQLRADRQDR